ncbi:hypothetical protein WG622_11450 [Cognatishimia sp. D5M38]|uniref:Uncharacterized protein n=1 Tax=Cognatishimia coralii TaxID=3083254 RepID=A0ABU8QHG5_9RHOB
MPQVFVFFLCFLISLASLVNARAKCTFPAEAIDPESWLDSSKVDPITCMLSNTGHANDCGNQDQLDPDRVVTFFEIFNELVEDEVFDSCHVSIMWLRHMGDITWTEQMQMAPTGRTASDIKQNEIRKIMRDALN